MIEKKSTEKQSLAPERRGQKPAWWSFRVSTGITAGVLFPLLARHKFDVSPSRLPALILTALISLALTLPARSQRKRFGEFVAATDLPPPVFIVGHWRSGTTYLHELLATDRRFLTPTYMQTFATDFFLRWGGLLRRLDAFVPSRRPMDDVAAGWDKPQEDEFGLLATGARSPYEVMLFPNDRDGPLPYLDIETMAPAEQRAWREALVTIMRRVVFAAQTDRAELDPETRLLLKSPTHTARIGALHRMFPNARFVHVTRDPFAVFPSTEHLWRRMFQTQSFQRPLFEEALSLTDFINNSMTELYRNFDRDVAALPEGQFAETRYQDLVSDPEGEVQRLHRELGLPEADAAALGTHLHQVRDYRPNRFTLDRAAIDAIRSDWQWYFERFGYDPTGPDAL
ncbi:MAG: sulfotransferase family protein [Alphaproteobacteria bacterium]